MGQGLRKEVGILGDSKPSLLTPWMEGDPIADKHTHPFPFSYPLGVIYTHSLFPVTRAPSFLLLVTHPRAVHPRSPNLSPSYTHLPLSYTPPLMSLLHTSMCHTQPQPLWSHTHTLSLSHTLTSFFWFHPTPNTPVSHTLNCLP